MFKQLFEAKEEYVVVDDSQLPNAIQKNGSTWGISNVGTFLKSLKDDKSKAKKYIMDKKTAEKLAKIGNPKFGNFKALKV